MSREAAALAHAHPPLTKHSTDFQERGGKKKKKARTRNQFIDDMAEAASDDEVRRIPRALLNDVLICASLVRK